MIIPLVVAGLVGGAIYLWRHYGKQLSIPASAARGAIMQGVEQNPPADTIPFPPFDTWVRLSIDGEEYLVSPTYIAPIGIGEAIELAKEHGFTIPTPRMVDAIWREADLKIKPTPIKHDGTFKTMNSRALSDKHREMVEAEIGNQGFRLLAGSHKDIVFIPEAFGKVVKKPGIYGWHRPDGTKIQSEMWGHGLAWKDYSQGLRPIKKV